MKTLFIHLAMHSKIYTKYVEYRGQVQVNFYRKSLHVIRTFCISRIIILTDSVLHISNLDHAGSEKYDHNISDNNMCCHSQYVNYPGMYMGKAIGVGFSVLVMRQVSLEQEDGSTISPKQHFCLIGYYVDFEYHQVAGFRCS